MPISWKRFWTLNGQGLVLPREKDMPPVVDTRYDSELGLTFAPTAEPSLIFNEI